MPTKKKTAKKAASKKAATKKAPAKKAAATKKAASKKAAVKKSVTKKAAPKKTASKKAAVTKAASKKSEAAIDVQPLYGEPYKLKKGEEYMNPNHVEHFRNILNMWRADLMQEVDRTVHHMQDEAANFPDPNDRASQETDFALELRARDRERKLIRKIDESLDMLSNEEYGYCEICGVEIGVRRLEARPTANLCIDCKTLDEIREKQMG
jgi:DnaK suppressor protein